MQAPPTNSLDAHTTAPAKPTRAFRYALWAALFGTALCLATLWNRILLQAQLKLHLNDLGKFFYDAQAFAQGRAMYTLSPATDTALAPGSSIQLLNLNPPHMHLLLLPFTSASLHTMQTLWLMSGIGCVAIVLYKTLQATTTSISAARLFVLFLALLASAAFGSIIATGQITMHFLPLIAWSWLAARRNHWYQSAIALGLALSIKPFLLILLPWLALRGGIRPAAVSLLAASLCFIVGLAIFGPDTHLAWLAALSQINWHELPLNASLQALITRALSNTSMYEPLALWPDGVPVLTIAGFIIIGVASLSVVSLDRSPEATDRAYCLLLLAALLMSPLGWIYYLLLALPPAIGLMSSASRPSNPHPPTPSLTRHVRRAGLTLASALVMIPTIAVTAGQPAAWLTISLGSAHFWVVFLFWLAAYCDARCSLAAQRIDTPTLNCVRNLLLRKTALPQFMRLRKPTRSL